MRTVMSLAFLAIASAAFGQPAPAPSLNELVRGSGFIFVGTVKAIGEATPDVPRQPNTAVVSVDRVVEALPPVTDLKVREVTVRLRDPRAMKAGQSATFFTYVYSAGESLGLEEVGTLPAPAAKELSGRVREARQELADEALSKRLATAQLVILGTIEPAADSQTDKREPVSEHDPMWRAMQVRAESFEKGVKTNEPPVVYVATSTDVMWRLAPKPKPGESGIFLLQPSPGPDHWSGVKGLFLVDPLDALPRSELERVRRLLKASR